MSALSIGVRTGLLIGFVALFVGVIMARKNKKESCNYDERQMAIRGIGYRYGFWTLAIELIVYGVNAPLDGSYIVAPAVAVFAMIFIAELVLCAYNIWHDAYFSIKQQRNKIMALWICVAAIEFAVGLKALEYDTKLAQGIITEPVGLPFVVSGFFVIFFVILAVKSIADKKESAE